MQLKELLSDEDDDEIIAAEKSCCFENMVVSYGNNILSSFFFRGQRGRSRIYVNGAGSHFYKFGYYSGRDQSINYCLASHFLRAQIDRLIEREVSTQVTQQGTRHVIS